MDASWTGLLITLVGVAGTLGAALLTQNRADRTKRMELQAAAEQRRENVVMPRSCSGRSRPDNGSARALNGGAPATSH